MNQKILKVGSSAAVTISKSALQELGLNIGDAITAQVDAERQVFSIQPLGRTKTTARERKIMKLTLNFVDRYRADLESLAQK